MDAAEDFAVWLRRNNIHIYQESFADEGYDDLESFSLIPAEEIEELCKAVKMKPGHRRKMPGLVDRAREEIKLEMARKKNEMERETREMEVKKLEEEQDRKRRIRDIAAEEKRVQEKDARHQKAAASKTTRPDKAERELPEGKR